MERQPLLPQLAVKQQTPPSVRQTVVKEPEKPVKNTAGLLEDTRSQRQFERRKTNPRFKEVWRIFKEDMVVFFR